MTDSQPPKATPARRSTAKAAPKADATAAKAPAPKTTTPKTTAAKTPAAKTTTATKAPTAKAPAAKTTPAKPATPRTRTTKPKTEAAPQALAPIEPIAPVAASAAPTAAAPTAAAPSTAPAGWYPVAAGSATQRYWDGTAWTEHVHDPAAAAAAAQAAVPVAAAEAQPTHEHLRAPEGTKGNTLWMWLTVGSMAITVAYWVVTAIYWAKLTNVNLDYEQATANPWVDPLYLVSIGLGLLFTAAMIVFPVLDWSALRKRGVPKPFSWAWSLFAIPLGSPIVYVIGRTAVVKRRTGSGLAPLWVFIGLQALVWIAAIIALIAITTSLVTGFLSIFNDQVI